MLLLYLNSDLNLFRLTITLVRNGSCQYIRSSTAVSKQIVIIIVLSTSQMFCCQAAPIIVILLARYLMCTEQFNEWCQRCELIEYEILHGSSSQLRLRPSLRQLITAQ